jgi:hypothetical protein
MNHKACRLGRRTSVWALVISSGVLLAGCGSSSKRSSTAATATARQSAAGSGQGPAGSGQGPAGSGQGPAGSGQGPAGSGQSPAATGATQPPTATAQPTTTASAPSTEASPGVVRVSSGAITATMHASTHHPRVNERWPVAFLVTHAGRPAKAEVAYEYLFAGQVVAHRSHYRFTGSFHDVFQWPSSAVGYPLTFRAVIVSATTTLNLDYPVQVVG